ncbi:initiation factor 2 [Hypoxylon sp. FL1150]|nr:initiation factor 2 [Hypoxylon sp. FL1150]
MLRAGISKRETSICAFCRHRLSLQSSTPWRRRQFSSTRYLAHDDGWGSWGGFKSPIEPKQDDFLNEHEVLARKQLLEKQQAEQRAPEPPNSQAASNGLQARYVWNVERQKQVEGSLRRDGTFLQNNPPRPARNSEPRDRVASTRPVPSGFNSECGPNHPRQRQILRPIPSGRPFGAPQLEKPGEQSDRIGISNSPIGFSDQLSTRAPKVIGAKLPLSNNNISSAPTVRGVAQGLTANKTQIGSNGRKVWDSKSLANDDSRSLPSSVKEIDPSSAANRDSDWGLLARKQVPDKSNSEDFWAAMNNTFTKPRGAEVQGSHRSTQTSERPGTKSSWAAMEESLAPKPKSPGGLYDWGQEFDKKSAYRRTDQSQPSSAAGRNNLAQTIPETSYGIGERSQTRVSQDRNRDRGKRVDRGGGGSRRRSGRASRFSEDDDEGFDYDQYQERRKLKAQRKAQRESERAGPTPILLPELISITALAEALEVKPNRFLNELAELGFEGVNLDSLMGGETAALVAQEYGFEPTVEAGADRDLKPRPLPEDLTSLPQRPPVVTIMGHVDHGKTTLLDYLRKSSVAAQEHGGITQRIGAFSVKLSSGKPITFLDTPGHAAFLTMRQRGAYVTDIVVLVVAADDSVKPQTIEAIKHARSAKVPMIVAINKIDKDGARIDQVKHDLAREGVEIEDFGGDVQVVCVSGKTGQGMDDLEENILTLSEILDHRAEVDGPAEGWILESSLKPIGKAATVLVKRGTLRPGDYIAAGLTWAKIRHLRSEAGVDIDEAPPGTPVEILGWKDLPAAGDQVLQAPDEGRAKDAVNYREGLAEREKDAAAQEVISEARRALQEKRAREKAAAGAGIGAAPAEALPDEENGTRMVNFVVKGDLHGSVEAVCAAMLELGNHEVRPRILRSTTGPIHEFDVEHAATSKSVVVNFATTTPGYIKRIAEEQNVTILDHNVIYHLVDDVKKHLSSYLAPEISSRVLGEAEVLQVFPINLKGRTYKNIAGCRVRNGLVARGSLFRVYRAGEKIYDGKLETLKHVKRDITEARKGTECGIGFEEFQDFEVGDQIQAYEEVKTQRSL